MPGKDGIRDDLDEDGKTKNTMKLKGTGSRTQTSDTFVIITKIKKGQYHRNHKIVIDVLQQIKMLLVHVRTPEKQSVSVFRVEILVR